MAAPARERDRIAAAYEVSRVPDAVQRFFTYDYQQKRGPRIGSAPLRAAQRPGNVHDHL